ncbi:MAG: hypothetical protein IM638_15860 [Bacteroidetes bacterium]|nr:hypothetical protein [Bacteroidota bacterium]
MLYPGQRRLWHRQGVCRTRPCGLSDIALRV